MNPQRPPRKWFYACTESVSKDPTVTDPKAVCAWNWYHHMTPTRRREILKGELFDPDTDIKKTRFIFDPKRGTKIVVTYALTRSDIRRGELGRFRPMPLNKAIKLANKMLKGAYIQITLTKE